MRKIPFTMALVLFAALLSGCTRTDHNIKHYMNSGREIDEFAMDVLPDLDSLPEYEDIYYQYYADIDIPKTDTMLLVVIYDEEIYQAEKANVENNYTFLDHVIRHDDSQIIPAIPEYEFCIGTCEFRVIDTEDISYPHYFGMIATSDENSSIAYLYFYNQSLDYVGEPMEDFIKRYFPYEW